MLKNETGVIGDAVHLPCTFDQFPRDHQENVVFIIYFLFFDNFWFNIYFADAIAVSIYVACFIRFIIFSCQCCMWRRLCHNCSWNTFDMNIEFFLILFDIFSYFYLLVFSYFVSFLIFCIPYIFLNNIYFFSPIFTAYFGFFIIFIHLY